MWLAYYESLPTSSSRFGTYTHIWPSLSFATKASFPSAQFFLHHTTHIAGHTITRLFNIDINSNSINSISSNAPRYGGLYGSHRFSFVFTGYPKTRASTSTTAIKAQDVRVRFTAGPAISAPIS
jgi:hypothetical protein